MIKLIASPVGTTVKKFNKSDLKPLSIDDDLMMHMKRFNSLHFTIDSFGELIYDEEIQLSLVSSYIKTSEIKYSPARLEKMISAKDQEINKVTMTPIVPKYLLELIAEQASKKPSR